jgi:uncharacterized UBP type Zn finger protein
MEDQQLCEHVRQATTLIEPREHVCEECIKTGDNWVHLRVCQSCGATLCCDSSPNRHMTKHYHQTNHPLVISAEPGEKWMWCYQHEVFVEYQ